MRLLIVCLIVLAGCDGDKDNKKPDAGTIDAKLVDAPKPIDAAIDAPPDAPNMNVVTACKHACDAIGVCFMEPADQDCYDECAVDLADCTAQQVATIDACSTEMCGDIENQMSPLIDCITAVSCVEMAIAFPRR